MILYRAFYRESGQTTAAITVILLVILVTLWFTSLLGQASTGEVPTNLVFLLLGLQAARHLDVLLPFSFFLGVLLTLSRWYRDSEMTVIEACGISLVRLLRPVMAAALVTALIVAAASFYFTPLAYRFGERINAQTAAQPPTGQLAPGVFTESQRPHRIFYFEKFGPDHSLHNVFVSWIKDARHRVIVAKRGYISIDPKSGAQSVTLRDGTLYDGTPGQGDYRVVDFQSYVLRLEPHAVGSLPATIDGMTLWQLPVDRGGAYLAEWHWRVSKPLVVFVLAAFALGLAYGDARRGRMANLFAAVLVYFIYSNLLGLGQALLRNGRVPAALGLWWVHGGMALVAAYLIWRRSQRLPLLPGFRGWGRH